MSEAFYDTFDYPKYWRGREYEDRAERIALKSFFNLISSSKKDALIDIGGGFGRLASFYAPLFKKCLLVDPSQGLLDQAQTSLKFKNVELKQGSVEDLPSASEGFDVALMIRVAHHLQQPSLAFKEAYRVLKPGGYFILEYANKIHFLAGLRAALKGNLSFRSNLKPEDQTTRDTSLVFFLNQHPKVVEKKLQESGFKIVSCLSVSNFRSPILKKIIPLNVLLSAESIAQKILAKMSFGPSIFLLCQKPQK